MFAHDLGMVIIGAGPLAAYVMWLELLDRGREARWSDREVVQRWGLGILILAVSIWASQQ